MGGVGCDVGVEGFEWGGIVEVVGGGDKEDVVRGMGEIEEGDGGVKKVDRVILGVFEVVEGRGEGGVLMVDEVGVG